MVQAQEKAAPGSPAWQLKSRDQRAAGKQLAAGEELASAAEERSAAAAQREMSLHLSQLQPPTSREPAAPPEPSGRPNPFNRAAQHARAAGARPPPKWNQKQRGPALPGEPAPLLSCSSHRRWCSLQMVCCSQTSWAGYDKHYRAWLDAVESWPLEDAISRPMWCQFLPGIYASK